MFANKNFCESMGYTMEEITGKHHSMFLTDDYSNSNDSEALLQADQENSGFLYFISCFRVL
jgi:methyl-accepting chemotaxis protein